MSLALTPQLSQQPSLLCNHHNRASTAVTIPSLSTNPSVSTNITTSTTTIRTNSLQGNQFHNNYPIQPLIDLLRDSASKGSLKQVKAVHGVLLKSSFSDKERLILSNHLVNSYSKCLDYDDACKVFDRMAQRNRFSWTVMIVGSTASGYFHDGFGFFSQLLVDGILPDSFVFSAVTETCVGLDCVQLGKMVHAQISVRGFASHTVVATSLVNMYANLRMIEDSCRLFDAMMEHTEVSWNAMIAGFTLNGLHLEAFDCFLCMMDQGFVPNMSTLISVSKAVGQLGDVCKGKDVEAFASELGLVSNVHVGTALIDMYAKCGSLVDARAVFDSKFMNCGVNLPWNAIISCCSKNGSSEEALELFVRMCENNIKSDVYTYCSVFNAIASMKSLPFGKQVHALVLKSESDMMVTSVNNAIADAYAKYGFLVEVRKIFDRMEERNIVSWTTLATAYAQCSQWEEALSVFSQMRNQGFEPNQFTLSTVLVCCSGLCLLECGRQVHALVCKVGLNSDKCIESALIDMYAKCGSRSEAEKVFEKISSPDTVSWTAMISAYAQHGLSQNALQLFTRMEQAGVKANAVTLLSILVACSHGGLLETGLQFFRSMEDKYDLVPEMEHYSCIVDLFGRVGQLDDAIKFIRKMPIEPSEIVWQTLLGACRVHSNVELAEIAAKKVLSTKPNPATYVLLSNIYKESGNLREGQTLREVMKEQGIIKEPGCSWISVGGMVQSFYAGEQNNLQNDQLHALLEDLLHKVSMVDDVLDVNTAL